MRIPLNVGWLSENDLLLNALRVIFPRVELGPANKDGILIYETGRFNNPSEYLWTDNLYFNTNQLKEMVNGIFE